MHAERIAATEMPAWQWLSSGELTNSLARQSLPGEAYSANEFNIEFATGLRAGPQGMKRGTVCGSLVGVLSAQRSFSLGAAQARY